MRKLQVYIEIEGMQTYVGSISGSSPNDAQFAYSVNILLQAIRLFLSVCLFRVSRLAQRQQKTFLRDCFLRDLPGNVLPIGSIPQKMII